MVPVEIGRIRDYPYEHPSQLSAHLPSWQILSATLYMAAYFGVPH